jgi:hypothetical protein
MTDDTDERGEEYVARQRGGDHLPVAQQWLDSLTPIQNVSYPSPHQAGTQTMIDGPVYGARDVARLLSKIEADHEEALRACEARVRTRRVNKAEYRQAYRDGKNDMLDAARDAVAALSKPDFHWANATDGQCGIEVGYEHALAAIDALRGAE